ncbi:MAG: type II secretion system secretin GspD [Tabrizicola sp.]|jgi:general secretion pathway protein D|nr:type II secretion system secretin GspD [Tabrizicola sp.]
MTIRKPSGRTILAISLALLTACDDGSGSGRRSPLLANGDGQATRGEADSTGVYGAGIDTQRDATRRRVGTDDFLGDTGAGDRPLIEGGDSGGYTLNLVNVPIEQAARAVFGNALQKNYSVDPSLTGTVTLQTTRPLSAQDLLNTFQTVLELNGAAIVSSGDLVKIVPAENATRRIGGPSDLAAGSGRLVAVPLTYISTTEMVRLLDPISSGSLELQAIPNRNVLLIGGTRDEINAAIEAINLFDVDVMEGKSVGLFKLRAAEPEAVVAELQSIFETGDGGSLQNVVTFLPSQRLGAIIVVTSRSSYLAEAEQWIRDLDSAAGGTKRRPVVYTLQNRAAAELAPILSEMLGEVTEGETETIEGNAKVVADDAKNALIVWGNDSEQESFARLIQSLDTTPVQVLLEATIAEVALNDELNFGLRWYFENGGDSARLSDAPNGAVTSTFPGLSLLFENQSAGAALNALQSVTDVNVVSSPSLLVVDNKEATLQIGDQVPIATQQSRDTENPDAPIINTISFRDTGIILKIKPRVSSSGQVVLDIEQEVSSVTNTTTSGIDSPTISQRKIKTSVVVTDGRTIALGGLIEESRNRTTAGVPGAAKVPVLGTLFRNRKDRIAKTELLVLITPRVIRDGHEAQSVTEELRRRIKGANDVVVGGVSANSAGHRIIN